MPVYYEAAVVIIALVFVGQVLELRARERTGDAIRALLDLAAALLEAPSQRRRGITPQRILEGLVIHHLGGSPALRS